MPLAIHDPKEEVRRLLAAGANPSIANREGKTPLETASLFGHQDIEQLLGRHISGG